MTNQPTVTVTLCRGCCCGSERKHPSTDHDRQRRTFEDLASERVRVRVVDCIDRCERSNVVLVRQHLAPGKQRDTWFGDVHYRAHTDALATWVAEGCSDLPQEAAHLRIAPPKSPRRPGGPQEDQTPDRPSQMTK